MVGLFPSHPRKCVRVRVFRLAQLLQDFSEVSGAVLAACAALCENGNVFRIVVTIGAAALVLPTTAHAALSFAFDRAQARPGQIVRAFQADPEGNPAPAWGTGTFDSALVTIYLVRLRAPNDWRLLLGPMRTDDRGVWSIAFRMPKIRPGLYTTAFYCRPCGDTFFPSTTPGDQWTPKPSRVLKISAPRRR